MAKNIHKVAVMFLVAASPMTIAEDAKDCLLKGTVVHKEQAGQEITSVRIDSISPYSEESKCSVNKRQKLEFKLPHDSRVQAAPAGSEVQYRYRSDEAGGDSETILIES